MCDDQQLIALQGNIRLNGLVRLPRSQGGLAGLGFNLINSIVLLVEPSLDSNGGLWYRRGCLFEPSGPAKATNLSSQIVAKLISKMKPHFFVGFLSTVLAGATKVSSNFAYKTHGSPSSTWALSRPSPLATSHLFQRCTKDPNAKSNLMTLNGHPTLYGNN